MIGTRTETEESKKRSRHDRWRCEYNDHGHRCDMLGEGSVVPGKPGYCAWHENVLKMKTRPTKDDFIEWLKIDRERFDNPTYRPYQFDSDRSVEGLWRKVAGVAKDEYTRPDLR